MACDINLSQIQKSITQGSIPVTNLANEQEYYGVGDGLNIDHTGKKIDIKIDPAPNNKIIAGPNGIGLSMQNTTGCDTANLIVNGNSFFTASNRTTMNYQTLAIEEVFVPSDPVVQAPIAVPGYSFTVDFCEEKTVLAYYQSTWSLGLVAAISSTVYNTAIWTYLYIDGVSAVKYTDMAGTIVNGSTAFLAGFNTPYAPSGTMHLLSRWEGGEFPMAALTVPAGIHTIDLRIELDPYNWAGTTTIGEHWILLSQVRGGLVW